jgi:hypothetical protein
MQEPLLAMLLVPSSEFLLNDNHDPEKLPTTRRMSRFGQQHANKLMLLLLLLLLW